MKRSISAKSEQEFHCVIMPWEQAGWRITSRTDWTVHFEKSKQKSVLVFFSLLFLGGLPGLLYAFWPAPKRTASLKCFEATDPSWGTWVMARGCSPADEFEDERVLEQWRAYKARQAQHLRVTTKFGRKYVAIRKREVQRRGHAKQYRYQLVTRFWQLVIKLRDKEIYRLRKRIHRLSDEIKRGRR